MNPPDADDGACGPARAPDRTREGDRTDTSRPVTAASARARVTGLLVRAGVGLGSVTAADALLMTSELVSNAIRHGGGVTALDVRVTGAVLHIAVSDASSRHPVARTGSPESPGGYGWPLVQRLAEHVTVRTGPTGKTISATLRLS